MAQNTDKPHKEKLRGEGKEQDIAKYETKEEHDYVIKAANAQN
eukprot:gene4083-4635_t